MPSSSGLTVCKFHIECAWGVHLKKTEQFVLPISEFEFIKQLPV